MTNQEIINTLNTLLETGNYKLPFQCSWAIVRNTEKLKKIYNLYDAERLKIIKDCCEMEENEQPKHDENGNLFFKSDEDKTKYAEEMTELLNLDNPDIDFYKISPDCLFVSDPKFDVLTPAQIETLQFMFIDEN